MGNHAIGNALVIAVEMAGSRRREGETALAIFDEAAERVGINGADAEFDDAPWIDGPFRSLLIEAFNPTFVRASDDEDDESFLDDVYEPFRKRYELC